MTPTQADHAMKYLGGLFRGLAKWSAQEATLFADDLERLRLEPAQVAAVMEQHRRVTRGNYPDQAKLRAALAEIVRKETVARQTRDVLAVGSGAGASGPVRSYREHAEANKGEPGALGLRCRGYLRGGWAMALLPTAELVAALACPPAGKVPA